MITATNLTKRFDNVTAVADLSFEIGPGRVTGFLGPNGAGKSTTMRMLLGLDAPTSGTASINGKPFRQLDYPLREVGALLDPSAVQGSRTARNHLRWLAKSNAIDVKRVDEVLQTVGLTNVANKRVGGFSLGMRQRLGIAASLLGDPGVLIYDEPVNGLDPEGIVWVRTLLRHLASEGRTVFVSSHLMNEMALMAERVIVIGKGRLITDALVDDVIKGATAGLVKLRTPELERMAAVIREHHSDVRVEGGALLVAGASLEHIGDLAAAHQVTVHELSQEKASLEAAFMELTNDSVEYRATESNQS